MNINFDDPSQMLSHVLLDNQDVARAVTKTAQWKTEGTVTPKVLMNGVEVPAEVMEGVLKKLFDQVEAHYREHYQADAFDAKVEEKACQLLKDHADNAIGKMQDLMMTLEESESLLTPYWERKNETDGGG